VSQAGVSRRTRIVSLIQENGYFAQADLARALGVSEMTIRRDSRLLATQGLVRAVRGGILSTGEPAPLVDYRVREYRNLGAKRAVARAAADLVKSGTTVALDAGTTTLELARLLLPPLRLKVVTSSLPAINVLADRPDIETITPGGTLSAELRHFTGPLALLALRQLRVDQVFLGATAVSNGAMYCNAMWESELKRALIDMGNEVILLADSSKFSMTAMTRVAPLTALTTVIVDDMIPLAEVESMQSSGIRVVTVSADGNLKPERSELYQAQFS
jgi:DeoR/GlpR family transcriptional regulator of sugar metabolism